MIGLECILVDQASARELGLVLVTERFVEATLMVIVAMSGRVVDAAHIDDDRQGREHRGIARSNHGCVAELLGLSQEEGRERLVAVKPVDAEWLVSRSRSRARS